MGETAAGEHEAFHLPKAPHAGMVILSLVVVYVAICGMASLCLGPVALVLSVVLVMLQLTVAAETLDYHHPSITWLLIIWMFTEPIAAYVGSRNHQENYAPYLMGVGGRRYTNISASDKASAHLDAGIITFSEHTVLDDSRSIGFRGFGHTYCAAPIVSSTAPAAEHSDIPLVEFWAVGIDCCGQRGSFQCDDAGESSAHGGVVLHDPKEEGMADMASGIIKPRFFRNGYLRAIEASSALYQLQTVGTPVLVTWSSEPAALLRAWFLNALLVWIGSSVAYGVLVTLVWCFADYYYTSTHQGGKGHPSRRCRDGEELAVKC